MWSFPRQRGDAAARFRYSVARARSRAEAVPERAAATYSERGMKRIVAFGLIGAFVLSATGCSSQDALMKELLANLNACAEVIEKKEPKEKLQAALERTNTTADKINKLKLSKEDQEALFKKYEPELKKVTERLQEAQKTRKAEGTDDDLP